MNDVLKQKIKDAGLFQWQIAKSIGVTAGTLMIWMRDDPMPEERKQKILDAIRREAKKDGTVND